MPRLEEMIKNGSTCMPEKEKNHKLGMGNRLRPIIEIIAFSEFIFGMVLIVTLVIIGCDYDKLYETEDTRLITLMSFAAAVFFVLNGLMLLTSLSYNQRRVMGFYILISTFHWMYMFGLSVLKIHLALLVIEKDDTLKVVLPENRHFLLSNACIIGVCTMLVSVIHFVCNVTVFLYYNLKYRPFLVNTDR